MCSLLSFWNDWISPAWISFTWRVACIKFYQLFYVTHIIYMWLNTVYWWEDNNTFLISLGSLQQRTTEDLGFLLHIAAGIRTALFDCVVTARISFQKLTDKYLLKFLSILRYFDSTSLNVLELLCKFENIIVSTVCTSDKKVIVGTSKPGWC